MKEVYDVFVWDSDEDEEWLYCQTYCTKEELNALIEKLKTRYHEDAYAYLA